MNKHEPKPKTAQLNLKDPETRALAEELARNHSTSLNGAVKAALQEKPVRDAQAKAERLARVTALLEPYWAAPTADNRTADEILGYDENGLPT
jgi:antitoxin VapB